MPTCRPIGITPRLLAKICSKVGVRKYRVRVDSRDSAPKTRSTVDAVIGALRSGGPMSIRRLESVTGCEYQTIHAALNSGPGTAHIRKVPGTSAPALYELIK